MNQEIKTRWVSALRQAKQNKKYLRTEDCFCAMGVLCELYRQEHETLSYWNEEDNFVIKTDTLETYRSLAPSAVLDWAEIKRGPFDDIYLKQGRIYRSIEELNDGNLQTGIPSTNLSVIADLIEEQL